MPTEAEQEFFLRGGGISTDLYPFGNSYSSFLRHAWSKCNSNNRTHPVAQKDPILIQEKSFYDLLGNIWEWGQDTNGKMLYGKNPIQTGVSPHRVLRGGSWDNSIEYLDLHIAKMREILGKKIFLVYDLCVQ